MYPDALAGAEPETTAEQQRKQDRERMERAFPRLAVEEPGAVIPCRADRLRAEMIPPALADNSHRG